MSRVFTSNKDEHRRYSFQGGLMTGGCTRKDKNCSICSDMDMCSGFPKRVPMTDKGKVEVVKINARDEYFIAQLIALLNMEVDEDINRPSEIRRIILSYKKEYEQLLAHAREEVVEKERKRIIAIVEEQVRLTPIILASGYCISASDWKKIIIEKIVKGG
jgi:hypothetical protein